MKKLQAIRGMNDILPEDMGYWHCLEDACRTLTKQYAYQEIRFPIVESTALFKRSIGEVTDIVEKEMYTFEDRNGDSLSLRPEGTACCVRAGIEKGLLHNQIRRLWYMGPMFRHERPQKGRYRQFHQLGVEAYGMSGPEVEVEQILLSWRLWKLLGIDAHVELQINSLGSKESRKVYREVLVDYFQKNSETLDADSQRRLTGNPLRILDSKNPDMKVLIDNAPKLVDYLDEPSRCHFEKLQSLLDGLDVPYILNPSLVRGLDYYCHTVFEWVTDLLGAQGTVCAGGRYDGLVEQLGGKATTAFGFASGLERLILLLKNVEKRELKPHVFGVFIGESAIPFGMQVIEHLRDQNPQLVIDANLAGGSFKSQFKRADKSGARWALVIAEDEAKNQVVTLKDLRGELAQQSMAVDELTQFFLREVNTRSETNG